MFHLTRSSVQGIVCHCGTEFAEAGLSELKSGSVLVQKTSVRHIPTSRSIVVTMGSQGIAVLVLGLGNLLMGDDGLGVCAAEALQAGEWPEGILVIGAGTSAISYLDEISRSDSLIAIDAVRAGGKPGSVYHLILEEMSEPDWAGQGSHGPTLSFVIALARSIAGLPTQVIVYGVEPENTDLSCGLSDAVNAALPKVTRGVRREVERILSLGSHGRGDGCDVPNG